LYLLNKFAYKNARTIDFRPGERYNKFVFLLDLSMVCTLLPVAAGSRIFYFRLKKIEYNGTMWINMLMTKGKLK
jgi:hypothetical protein